VFTHNTQLLKICVFTALKKKKVADKTRVTPSFLYKEEGEEAVLTCDSQKDVLWTFVGNENTKNTYEISKLHTLRILITAEDQGLYFCFGETSQKNKYFIAVAMVLVQGKNGNYFIAYFYNFYDCQEQNFFMNF